MFGCGIVVFDSGNKQKASDALTHAITLTPNDAYAYQLRGEVLLELGDRQGVIYDYTQTANLYKQQGKLNKYRESLKKIELLRR